MLNRATIDRVVAAALEEDAPWGDITSAYLIVETAIARADLVAHESGVFSGGEVFEAAFRLTDPRIEVELVVEDGAWFEVTVDGPLIANDKVMNLRAALLGVGIAFLVEDTARPHVRAGRLVPLLEAWSAPFPGLFLCYPQQRQMAPALRAFIDTMRAHASARRPSGSR